MRYMFSHKHFTLTSDTMSMVDYKENGNIHEKPWWEMINAYSLPTGRKSICPL